MLSADDLVAIIRPALDRAESPEARRAALARLGGDEVEAPAAEAWPPTDVVVSGPDWITVKSAIHESGRSETTIRKYRREIGVYRAGQWYIFRPRLERILPKPHATSQ